MRIDKNTKYREFEPIEKYVPDSQKKAITNAAESLYGCMYDLEFSEFWNVANGDLSRLGNLENPTVFQRYWLKRFEEFTKEFAETLNKLSVKQTSEEKRAADGCLKISWGESVLVFLQKFFGLKSFKEAEKITLGEILIAKRAQYNDDLFARRMSQIQMQKIKPKK